MLYPAKGVSGYGRLLSTLLKGTYPSHSHTYPSYKGALRPDITSIIVFE